jgi:hypothetical protein
MVSVSHHTLNEAGLTLQYQFRLTFWAIFFNPQMFYWRVY